MKRVGGEKVELCRKEFVQMRWMSECRLSRLLDLKRDAAITCACHISSLVVDKSLHLLTFRFSPSLDFGFVSLNMYNQANSDNKSCIITIFYWLLIGPRSVFSFGAACFSTLWEAPSTIKCEYQYRSVQVPWHCIDVHDCIMSELPLFWAAASFSP